MMLNESQKAAKDKLFVALDGMELEKAMSMIEQVAEYANFKIGMEMFTAHHDKLIALAQFCSSKVFLDMKYHDIPRTTARAIYQATKLGVDIINVHATGGSEMMQAVVEARNHALHDMGVTTKGPDLIAVTVLTTIDQKQFNEELLLPGTIEDYVLHLAELTKASGMDGIVCSAKDLLSIDDQLENTFLKVTPGIRFPTDDLAGQKRVLSPQEAIKAGATHLVVGTPITTANCPSDMAFKFMSAIESAMNEAN